MVMRVRQIGNDYFVPLSPEAVEALHLSDGSTVELRVVEAETGELPTIEYLSKDEALGIFRATELQHREAYEILAK